MSKPMPKDDPSNNKLLKAVGLTGGIHLAQNVATRGRLRSGKTAKQFADAFAEGTKGVVDKSLKRRVSNAVTGTLTPDVQVMRKSFHDAGNSLRPLLKNMSKRQQVGLRMASQGRYSDLVRKGFHKDPKIQQALDTFSKATKNPVPNLGKLTDTTAREMDKLWSNSNLPAFSNISKNISRGKVSPKAKAGRQGSSDAVIGSAVTSVFDPLTGGPSLIKNLATTSPVRKNKYARKAVDFGEKQFVHKPAKAGWASPNNPYTDAKSKAFEYGVNPASVEVKRTSSAMSGIASIMRATSQT